MKDVERKVRAQRQDRVAKVVWGSLFVVMGVLFTLHDMGRIDLGEPSHQYAAQKAVDGDVTTRWSSSFHDPQWLLVDLGAPLTVGRVRLQWEQARAKDYELQVSNDGLLWSTARKVTDADGGTDEQELGTTARFVRMLGTRRNTPYGYSLYELQIYDAAGNLVSQGRRAAASSTEDHGPFALWLRFWPLLLVASGLPLVLAPRDDSNQVLGMVLTAAGAFLQLQGLGLVTWGVRETASLVLIGAGVVILLQSQRRAERPGGDGPGAFGDPS
jgi:hypothetical protein